MTAGTRAPRWIVDGMNVIGSVPDAWWRDRDAAMRRLVAAVDAWAEHEEAERVLVVLDGRPRAVGEPDRVEVSFAGGGRDAADHLIAERVESDEDPDGLQVVTSDRELAERVGAAGAGVVPARAFRSRVGMGDDRR